MGRPRKSALRLPPPETEEFEDDSPEMTGGIMADEERADMELELSGFLPLFPDADKAESRTPAAITVHRIKPDGREYCGKLEPNATEETIYHRFGNGTYDLGLVDENTRYLRSPKKGVKIAMTIPREIEGVSSGNGHAPGIDAGSIREILREERQRSVELIAAERASLAARSSEDRHRADAFLAMIMESRKSEAEQMRMFFQANERSAQESFKQILGIMSTGHTMQMQAMQANTQKPNEMIQALMLGMQLAQGIDPEAEEKPSMIEQMIAGMVPMIGGLTAQAKAKPPAPPPKRMSNGVPAPRQMVAPQPNPAPAPLVTAAPVPSPELAPPKKKGALSEEEIEEIKALKILTAKRGISMADVIKQGRAYLETVGGALPEEEEDEEEFEDPEEPELDEEGNPVSPSEEESSEESEDSEEEDSESDDDDDETEDDSDTDSESDEGPDDET